MIWVDAQLDGMVDRPTDACDTVVQAGWERLDLGRRGRREAVAEVDHRHCQALMGQHAAPHPVHRVEARAGLHTSAMEVHDTGDDLVAVGTDELDLDGVAVRHRRELSGLDLQSGNTNDRVGERRRVHLQLLLPHLAEAPSIARSVARRYVLVAIQPRGANMHRAFCFPTGTAGTQLYGLSLACCGTLDDADSV